MIRNKPIYLSHEVYQCLRLIGKATPARSDACQIQTATPDEIADTLLRDVISQRYPQFVEHRKQIEKLEAQLISTLQSK